MNSRVDLIVPIFNEQDSLRQFLDELHSKLNFTLPINFGLLFVDDGSVDNSWNELQNLRSDKFYIQGIRLARNSGKELALLAGMQKSSADAMIPIDVDLQDPPEIVNLFIEKWLSGSKMVVGRRKNRKGEKYSKIISADIFYRFYNWIADVPIPKNVGDFRIIDKELTKNLSQIRSRNVFMKGTFAALYEADQIIEFERKGGLRSKKNKPKQNWAKLLSLAELAITSAGPKLFRKLLGLSLIFDLLLSFFILIIITQWLIWETPFNGFATIAIFLATTLMVQLTFLSTLGVILSRLLQHKLNLPVYLISEIFETKSLR